MILVSRLAEVQRSAFIFCCVLALFSGASRIFIEPARADIIIQNGQKVDFMGDSITAYGWSKPAGYVNLFVSGLAANGVTVNPIPAGVGGNTSVDMAARLNADVLSKMPDWLFLSCGVNDAFAVRNVSVAQYEANITSIVDQCEAAHIKVLLITPTPIAEDWKSDVNVRLGAFNDFLRQLAAQKDCVFADVNAAMQDAIEKKAKPAYTFTVDGVHMDPAGDFVMATTILQTLGVTSDGIKAAQARWMDIAGGVPVEVTVPMTPRQWFAL